MGVAQTELPVDRLPPCDVEAEKSVLGSIALAPETLDEVRTVIGHDCFYVPSHRMIYRAMEAMYEAGRAIDTVLLRDELQARGQLEEVGGVQGLLSIIETVPHAYHAVHYAEIVRDKWLRRELLRIGSEIAAKAHRQDIEPQESLDSAEKMLCRLGAYESAEVVPISLAADEMLTTLADKAERTEDDPLHGLPIEWESLRSLIDYWGETCVYVIAARPGQGKTAFALQVAVRASQAGSPVLMLSLEMPRVQLAERVTGLISGVSSKRIRNGQVWESNSDQVEMELAITQMKQMPLRVYDGRLTVSQLRGLVRKECRTHGCRLVVIDYLQLIDAERTKYEKNRNDTVSEITREIKLLSNEMRVPILVLSQLNRGVEARENKTPRLSDLRESGAIEQDADVVMFIHRPDTYDKEDNPGMAVITVAKNRHGPTGTSELRLRKETGRFSEWQGSLFDG